MKIILQKHLIDPNGNFIWQQLKSTKTKLI